MYRVTVFGDPPVGPDGFVSQVISGIPLPAYGENGRSDESTA